MTEVTIDPRFCGPPDSGNGGYVCGLVAQHVDGQAEVTLLKPPPLNTAMCIKRDGDAVKLMHAAAVIAVAKPGVVDLTPPDPVDQAEARAGVERFPDIEDHVFPTCFVCGPARRPDDALCIFTGDVPGRDLVAAPWTPHASLANGDGVIRPEIVWAALDCPGAFAFDQGVGDQPIVLGRLAVRIDRPVRVGDTYAVVGWSLGREGRKRFAGTAIYDHNGIVCAIGKATWIAIDLATFSQ